MNKLTDLEQTIQNILESKGPAAVKAFRASLKISPSKLHKEMQAVGMKAFPTDDTKKGSVALVPLADDHYIGLYNLPAPDYDGRQITAFRTSSGSFGSIGLTLELAESLITAIAGSATVDEFERRAKKWSKTESNIYITIRGG